ncbi:MAG: PP2C family protein-serine/threonine phosphatase [Spirochaetota bacterium]
MGLTLLSFIAAVLLLFLSVAALRIPNGRQSLWSVALMNLFFAIFALTHGLVDLLSGIGESSLGLALSKVAAASLGLGLCSLIVFSLFFSGWHGRIARILAALVATGGIALVVWVIGSDHYMALIFGVPEGVIRFAGDGYELASDLLSGLTLVALVFLLFRSFLAKDRIESQRALTAAIGSIIGVVGLWVLGRAASDMHGAAGGIRVLWSFHLLALPILVTAGAVTYAIGIVRIFDWGIFARRILSWTILAFLYGLPLGVVTAALVFMGRMSFTIPLVGTPIAFLVARQLARGFAARRLGHIMELEYREDLESGLSHIDLSAGRDEVLAETHRLLGAAFDFAEFAVMIEDGKGELRSVYASTRRSMVIEKGSKMLGRIEAANVTVLLKSEMMGDPRWAEVSLDLKGFLELFRGEVVVFAREGRRVIGAFVMGARRSGSDYTDYDYESFRAIYGKLFVIAYYLKNVARESIVYTVSRELALSDQVIRYALEKVDRIDAPGIDSAWATRSTSSLGGDFVDFVRISKTRWFFVLGDISGNGMSAAMNMLILKSMIRTLLRVEKEFSVLVQRVNAFIKENLPKGTFFAGIFGYFDVEQQVFYFINCGVPILLLYSPNFDAFMDVQGEGRILGFVRDVAPFLKPRKILLPPGSMLVSSTDGIIESENLRADRFGKERLVRSVRGRLKSDSRTITDGVIEDLLDFTARRQEDDITLLVMKFNQTRRAI